jgi:hypothetical protein
MFNKILIANRGDDGRTAAVAAQPDRVVREAHAGDVTSMESPYV